VTATRTFFFARKGVELRQNAGRNLEIKGPKQTQRKANEDAGDEEIDPRIGSKLINAGSAEQNRQQNAQRREREDDTERVNTRIAHCAGAIPRCVIRKVGNGDRHHRKNARRQKRQCTDGHCQPDE